MQNAGSCLILLLLAATSLWPQNQTAAASTAKRSLYVAASGPADFSTVQKALDAASDQGVVISIAPGTYREILIVTKPHITLRGISADASKTTIVNNRSAGSSGSTLASATVKVTASDFTAENLTFANDFNATHLQEQQGSQALALLVTGDRAVFRSVRVLGNQDTLYIGSQGCSGSNGQPCAKARQYFAHCFIEGNVDFIFGDGVAYFEDCDIHSTPHSEGFITAQGKHYQDQDSIFIFNNCKLTAEPGVAHVWLGRPWRPFASVVFLGTEMGAHIEPTGWQEWRPADTNYLQTATYGEHNSTGPGAHAAERDPHARHLTNEQASQYDAKKFLAGADGWNPSVDDFGVR